MQEERVASEAMELLKAILDVDAANVRRLLVLVDHKKKPATDRVCNQQKYSFCHELSLPSPVLALAV